MDTNQANLTFDEALAGTARMIDTAPLLAMSMAREFRSKMPDDPRGALLLAMTCNACGLHEEAQELLGPLAEAHPNEARLWLELGLAQAGEGRHGLALSSLGRAAAAAPALGRVWLALADSRHAVGDAEGANSAYLEHLRYSQDDDALMEAATLLARGNLVQADIALRRLLERRPGDVAAMRMLAESLIRVRKYEEAMEWLERVLERAPDFDAARQNYAVVLNRVGRPAEALAEIEILLDRSPHEQILHDMKAVIQGRLGDFDSAIATYKGMLEKRSDQPEVWLGYGHALKTAGRAADAIAAYRRAAELRPGFGAAWWSLANLKTMRFTRAEVSVMRMELTRDDIDDEARSHFEFALGKAYEDLGEDAEAFAHYSKGNALRRRQVSYDADAASERVRYACRLYTTDFFAKRAGSGRQDPDPIFVVGMPRAGSTLVEQILSSHPLVEGTAELPAIIAITQDLRQREKASETVSYHDVLAKLGADELLALGERYMRRTRSQRRDGKPYFTDKMPNNFAHVGLIHLILPRAKIIDVRRHPLACCFSNFKQSFARGQTFSYDFSDLGRYYRDYVELMAHFDNVLPGRVYRVIYEDLVVNTETVVRRMLEYCGLAFDERCLRFFENDRAVRTASSEQVRKPIYRDGVNHWHRFEKWLDPLKASLGPVLASYPDVPESHR